MVGDALECVCNTGQLECNLVRSTRPLQHDNPFSAEIQGSPEHQANHDRYDRQKDVVACNGDASTRDSNQVI
jgi:hypothetical protein